MQYPFLRTSFFVGWSTPFAKTMFWLKGVIYMKIMYKFADGTITEVEVSEDIGKEIISSRQEEENLARKNRRHCLSLDYIDFEGEAYGICDTYDFLEDDELRKKVYKAFNTLTDVQKRRLLMLAKGMSIREIAKQENVHHRAVEDSINSAKKKFLKNF